VAKLTVTCRGVGEWRPTRQQVIDALRWFGYDHKMASFSDPTQAAGPAAEKPPASLHLRGMAPGLQNKEVA